MTTGTSVSREAMEVAIDAALDQYLPVLDRVRKELREAIASLPSIEHKGEHKCWHCGAPCRKEVLMRGGDNGWGDDESRTVYRYVEPERRAERVVTDAMVQAAKNTCVKAGKHAAYFAPETDEEWRKAISAALTEQGAAGRGESELKDGELYTDPFDLKRELEMHHDFVLGFALCNRDHEGTRRDVKKAQTHIKAMMRKMIAPPASEGEGG